VSNSEEEYIHGNLSGWKQKEVSMVNSAIPASYENSFPYLHFPTEGEAGVLSLPEIQRRKVLALAKLVEAHDMYVSRHSRKVTVISTRLACELNCTLDEMRILRWAALLHDIGKVEIAGEVLNRKGPLTPEEWKQMRRHPQTGAEIVRLASNLDEVADLILAHHEWYDGRGYPYGLQGEAIPYGARILSVADAYSAMTDERPYQPCFTHKQAVAEIQRCSGTQFDPIIVSAFVCMFGGEA